MIHALATDHVDVVNLDRAGPVVLREIALHGRLFYEAQPKAFLNRQIGGLGISMETASTDIERSTQFTSELGDARAQNLVRLHDQIVRERVEVGGGNVIRHTGDGMLAVLPSVSASIHAAVGIQRDLATREAPFRLRIGIDAGEPLREGTEVSGTVVQSARWIVDEGRVSLEGLRAPVRLFRVPWEDGS